ncbi:hypothetical protein P3X46_006318 [Hevea brasiliensis]|uniref:Embryo sac development arrest 6 n=1 Tax=Hevea brasiliensis TaxID=3981 RepID=A0ABQ9MRM8_HEVBR|nr:uncharacterized protein LOC110673624 [Hevea brasiliensis]KAJ9182310.1 hypothetical protein P3X46_006318 [Hevea brasiliensis]
MSYHPRRILPPGASKKRKEREAFYPTKPLSLAQLSAKPALKADEESVSSNRLLAGYMAYEFLTKGTLFGQRFDPARAEEVPLAGGSVQSKRGKPGWKKEHNKSYAEVASILKTDGAHITGIVNPSQLARWIQQ